MALAYKSARQRLPRIRQHPGPGLRVRVRMCACLCVCVCVCVCACVCVCLCFSLTHIVNLAVQHALFVSFLLSSRAQALPVIGRCIAGMVEAINMVDADADTELVVSNYRTGNAVPTDVAEHDPVRARACVYVCMCACVCPSPVPLPSPRLCTWPHPLPLGLG